MKNLETLKKYVSDVTGMDVNDIDEESLLPIEEKLKRKEYFQAKGVQFAGIDYVPEHECYMFPVSSETWEQDSKKIATMLTDGWFLSGLVGNAPGQLIFNRKSSKEA